MAETPVTNSGIPVVTDKAIDEITRALIGTFIKDVEEHPYGEKPIDKIRNYIMQSKSEKLLEGVADLTGYLTAQAAERQAKALEQIAAHVSAQQVAAETSTRTQAITQDRESKLEYLTLTYSLSTPLLSLLWAMRGILMDASIKSLSVPDRLDPYRRVSTEEMALALRMSSEDFLAALPRDESGIIDFDLLEAFDVLHYNHDSERPDDWIYGG
jgi:hypothetical protein